MLLFYSFTSIFYFFMKGFISMSAKFISSNNDTNDGDVFNQNNGSSSPGATAKKLKKLKKSNKLSLADACLTPEVAPALKRFHISCTQQDYEHLSLLAKSSGLSTSAYLVEMGLSSSSCFDPKIRTLLESIFYELSFICSYLPKLSKLSTKPLDTIKLDIITSFLYFSSRSLINLFSSSSFKELASKLSSLPLPEAPFSPSKTFYYDEYRELENQAKLSISNSLDISNESSQPDDKPNQLVVKLSSSPNKLSLVSYILKTDTLSLSNLYPTTSILPNNDFVHFIPKIVHSFVFARFYFLDCYPLDNLYLLPTSKAKPISDTCFISNLSPCPFAYSLATSIQIVAQNLFINFSCLFLVSTCPITTSTNNSVSNQNSNIVCSFFSSLPSFPSDTSKKLDRLHNPYKPNNLHRLDKPKVNDTSSMDSLFHQILNNSLPPDESSKLSSALSSWLEDEDSTPIAEPDIKVDPKLGLERKSESQSERDPASSSSSKPKPRPCSNAKSDFDT